VINQSNLISYQKHSRPSVFSLKCPKKGTEEYIIDGVSHKVQEGQVIITRPRQSIQTIIRSDKEEPVTGICLYISEDELKSTFDKHRMAIDFLDILAGTPIQTQGTPLHETLVRLFSSLDDASANNAFLSLSEALLKTSASISARLPSTNARKGQTQLELWRQLETARIYIHKNYQAPIKVVDMAKAAHLSVHHFSRTFSAFYAMTPKGYLNLVRRSAAKELLSNSKYSPEQVALLCGFDSKYYMNKCLSSHPSRISTFF